MTDDKSAVSVSLKMHQAELAALDVFARDLEAELLKKGLRISVSRALAIRTLIERGMPADRAVDATATRKDLATVDDVRAAARDLATTGDAVVAYGKHVMAAIDDGTTAASPPLPPQLDP